MGVAEWTLVGLALLSMVAGVIGWLLSEKDKKQQEDINALFTRLRQLELDVAKNYHSKDEIRQLIDGLKTYLNERFDHLERNLGAK